MRFSVQMLDFAMAEKALFAGEAVICVCILIEAVCQDFACPLKFKVGSSMGY